MKIGTYDFYEIAKGIYITEDHKTLVMEVFEATKLDRSASDETIIDAIYNVIKDKCVVKYQDDIEAVLFDCGVHCGFCYKSIGLNAEILCSTFSGLNAVAHGSDITITNRPNENFRVVDTYKLDDIAFEAEENGDFEKAEYYYRWQAVVDYYWGKFRLARFLNHHGKEEEAEEYFKKTVGESDLNGDSSSEYGDWLHKQQRYREAAPYLHYASRPEVDTCNREYAIGILCDSIRKYKHECPYWKYFNDADFNKYLIYYLETDITLDTSAIEKVLETRASSEDGMISKDASEKIENLRSTGLFKVYNNKNKLVDIFSIAKRKKS